MSLPLPTRWRQPALVRDLVIVGQRCLSTAHNATRALSLDAGEPLWRADAGGDFVTWTDEVVVLRDAQASGRYLDEFVGLDLASGRERWRIRPGFGWDPTRERNPRGDRRLILGEHHHLVGTGSDGPVLVRLDPRTGAHETVGPWGVLSVRTDRALVCHHFGIPCLRVFDAEGMHDRPVPWVLSALGWAGSDLYLVSRKGERVVRALRRDDLEEVWQWEGFSTRPAFLGDSVVLGASRGGRVTRLDRRTGEVQWDTTPPNGRSQGGCYALGPWIVNASQYRGHLLRADSGAHVWSGAVWRTLVEGKHGVLVTDQAILGIDLSTT